MPFSGLRVVNCENAFYLWFGNLCFALIWPSLLAGRCLSWSSDINFWTAKVQSFRLELRITLSMHAVQCTPQSCYLSPLELRCDKKNNPVFFLSHAYRFRIQSNWFNSIGSNEKFIKTYCWKCHNCFWEQRSTFYRFSKCHQCTIVVLRHMDFVLAFSLVTGSN